MTLPERIALLERQLSEQLTTRTTQTSALATLRDRVTANDATVTEQNVTDAVAARSATDATIGVLNGQLTELRAELATDTAMAALQGTIVPSQRGPQGPADTGRQHGDGVVTAERRVYTLASMRGSAGEDQVSYFRDLYRWQFNAADTMTRDRMERHAKEVEVHGENELSMRATTTGSFAGLIPPQYLIEQAAILQRAGRPTANVVTNFQLPATGMSLIIPRGTTGASAAIQTAENTAVSSTDEVWANLTVPVVTIAGQQDVSRQALERGFGADQLIFMDIMGAYNVALDQQVLFGTGSSGQMLGILATSGVNQATAFTAAATTATFYTKVAGQLNAVETTRFLAPDVIIMHPRRWNWLLTQFDSQGRPLVVPNMNGPYNALGLQNGKPQDTPATIPVGWLFGLPVITDASIPTAVGTGPEDQVIIARKADLLLWEDGDGVPRELRFEQTLGANLTVKLVAYGYAAFTAGRYPTGVGIVGGNAGTAGFGLAAPTF